MSPHLRMYELNWFGPRARIDVQWTRKSVFYPLDAGVEDSTDLCQAVPCSTSNKKVSRKRTSTSTQLLSQSSRTRGVSSKRVALQPLHVDQSDAVEVTRRRNQDADLRQDGVNGHSLHACRAKKGSHSAINIRDQNHGELKFNTEAQSMPYLPHETFASQHSSRPLHLATRLGKHQ